MSLPENRIDPHRFISLQGQQIPPAMVKVIDDRNGVDGSEFVLVGKKGKPFSLVSVVDCESYEEARNTLTVYQRLIDGGSVEIVQGGVSSDSYSYRVVVLNVEALDIRAITGASGNYLNPPSQGIITARWDLIAVPLEE